ncbi:baseplate assembly protein [Burkholderia stagnalis]|uniref:phage baseplate assembly protein V n=1 Tax=Burkholderia stagnalis TaxID=1503054 RepID=UPI00075D1990|nr:phage baseplate assembly protein V [Burkholderia stagnalis]KVZ18643.1 baseplate assembly protein [Burkholderia stagnalis]KWN32866.1 baseplate assembly protein [Burkholderia stagnalis]KWN44693.1 baseplate assembly protein [Burkholderia stagnalis]KWN54426.1 baseplate assembly protein [Burkholderia stagnalis]KWO68833.1 baseplate assembly protein [Burkholderia stagnalis]
MIDQLASITSRLARRVLHAIGRGRVTASNDSGVVQLIQVRFNDLETIDGMPRIAEFGLTSRPPSGTDVLALFIGGDRSSGVVAGTNHQASRPKGLAIGETMLYSLIGQQVYLSTSGIVVEAKGLPVTVNNASDVTWNCSGKFKVVAPGGVEFDTPMVKSSGDIIDNSATNANTMAAMRTIYNGHKHVVTGVQSGSSQVTSNAPTQTE